MQTVWRDLLRMGGDLPREILEGEECGSRRRGDATHRRVPLPGERGEVDAAQRPQRRYDGEVGDADDEHLRPGAAERGDEVLEVRGEARERHAGADVVDTEEHGRHARLD